MSEQPTDGMLVAKILAGDSSQFSRLAERYQAVLLRVAQSRLGNRAWAEDVVQETLLCAFKFLHTYDSRYSFRTWLWTLLFNQCHRHARRANRQPRVTAWTDRDSRTSSDVECDQSRAVFDKGASPLHELVRRERSELLERLLARLPEAEGDALRLRFFGGLSFPEIAKIMGSGVSTAKVRVRRGLMQLAQWLPHEHSSDDSGDWVRPSPPTQSGVERSKERNHEAHD